MTGRYAWRMGLQNPETMNMGTKAHIPMDQPTVAELMKEIGYNTQSVGKWHLGYASWNYTPIGRGFNDHFGYYSGAEDYYTHILNDGYDFHHNKEVFWEGALSLSLSLPARNTQRTLYIGAGNYSSDLYFNYLFDYLNSNYGGDDEKDPLFLYLALQTVHAPMEPPPTNNHVA